MNHVVSIKTYLTDLGPYAVFSRIRGEFFPKDPPARTTVIVAALARAEFLIEIECNAHR